MAKRRVNDKARAAGARKSKRPRRSIRSRWPIEALSNWGAGMASGPHGAFLALLFAGNPLFLDKSAQKAGRAYIVELPVMPEGARGWRIASRFMSALQQAEVDFERCAPSPERCGLCVDQCQDQVPEMALGALMVGAGFQSRRPPPQGGAGASKKLLLQAAGQGRNGNLDPRRSRRLLSRGVSLVDQELCHRKARFALIASQFEKRLRALGFGLTSVDWLLDQRAGEIMERGIRADALAFAQSDRLKKELSAGLPRGAPSFDPGADGTRAGRL